MNTELHSQSVKMRPPVEFDFEPMSWCSWKERFEAYLKLSGNDGLDDVSKINLLLYTMGEQAEQLVKQLNLSKNKEYSEVMRAIDEYYKPKKNVVHERFKFNSRTQRDTEDVADFIQDLQVLIGTCEYGDLRDELLRDQIIVGLKDKSVTERLLVIPDLTLNETIRLVENVKDIDCTKYSLKIRLPNRWTYSKEAKNTFNPLSNLSLKQFPVGGQIPYKLKETPPIWSTRSSRRIISQTENAEKQVELDVEGFKVILNQLNEVNHKEFSKKVKNLKINTSNELEDVAAIVYEKALTSQEMAAACANISQLLSKLSVQEDTAGKKTNFRNLIITKCQNAFINDDDDDANSLLLLEMELTEHIDPTRKSELDALAEQSRNRKYGNIRFICELYKLKMLTGKILIFCMYYLIEKPKEDNLETLCILITSIGKSIESEAMVQLDVVFKKVENLLNDESSKISDRIREMLEKSILLRKRKWIQ